MKHSPNEACVSMYMFLYTCCTRRGARGGRPGGRACQATHITTFSYTKDLTRMVCMYIKTKKTLLPFLETLSQGPLVSSSSPPIGGR